MEGFNKERKVLKVAFKASRCSDGVLMPTVVGYFISITIYHILNGIYLSHYSKQYCIFF